MPHNPELEDKFRQLRAMEFILAGIIEKLAELSDIVMYSPQDLKTILQWQISFSEQIIELQEMIEEDMAKERLVEALSDVMSASEEK